MGIAEPVPFGALLEQLRECQQAGALPLVALQGGQPLRDLAVQPMPCTASNERWPQLLLHCMLTHACP